MRKHAMLYGTILAALFLASLPIQPAHHQEKDSEFRVMDNNELGAFLNQLNMKLPQWKRALDTVDSRRVALSYDSRVSLDEQGEHCTSTLRYAERYGNQILKEVLVSDEVALLTTLKDLRYCVASLRGAIQMYWSQEKDEATYQEWLGILRGISKEMQDIELQYHAHVAARLWEVDRKLARCK